MNCTNVTLENYVPNSYATSYGQCLSVVPVALGLSPPTPVTIVTRSGNVHITTRHYSSYLHFSLCYGVLYFPAFLLPQIYVHANIIIGNPSVHLERTSAYVED